MTDPRERMTLRPGELVGLAGVFGLFLGLITLMVTRDVIISLIAFGGTFVLGLVSLAPGQPRRSSVAIRRVARA